MPRTLQLLACLLLNLIFCATLGAAEPAVPIRRDRHGEPLPEGAIFQLGTPRLQHPSLMRLAWSPDGKYLLSTGYHNAMRLWDPATGKEVRRFQGNEADADTVAWSPDGKLLASGWDSESNTITLWNVATGQQVRQLTRKNDSGRHAGSGVRCLAWSPDGKLLASVTGRGQTICLWDPATGAEFRTLSRPARPAPGRASHAAPGYKGVQPLRKHEETVWTVAWSPDSTMLAAGSKSHTICLHDAATGKAEEPLTGHGGGVHALAWSPDGKTLASASADKTVRLWDRATARAIGRLAQEHEVDGLAWSPDGTTLALGSYGRPLRLWQPATGKDPRLLAGIGGSSVAWSPDGKVLGSKRNSSICLWDAATGQEIGPREGHESTVKSACWSPDGKMLASASWDNTVRLWDARTGHTIRVLERRDSYAVTLAFSADGRTLVGASDQTYTQPFSNRVIIEIWDVATGKASQRIISGHKGEVCAQAWSPDGRTLASGSTDKTIRLWEPATGEEIRRLLGHAGRVSALAWSPDGKTLASASDDSDAGDAATIRLWDPATGKQVGRLDGHAGRIATIGWAPGGRVLFSVGYGKTIRLWDVASRKEVRRLTDPGDAWYAALSPDGRTLAVADSTHVIRLIETATGQDIRHLAGHVDSMNSLAWSPDGTRLVSASSDTTLLVWAIRKHPDERPLQLQGAELQAERTGRPWRMTLCQRIERSAASSRRSAASRSWQSA